MKRDKTTPADGLPPLLNKGQACPWEGELAVPVPLAEGELEILPIITLVTPTFNAGGFLEKTIRSVVLQGYPKLQWIVMDGGSTDESLDIIKYYSRYFHVWRSEKDGGQSDAINRGFALAADDDLLGWLNGDDILLEGALWAIGRTWVANNKPDLILGNADLVDKNMALIHRQPYDKISPDELVDYRNNYLIQPGVFFSRRAWAECGPLTTDLHYAMDFELFYKMAQRFPIVRCHERVALSVFHENCKTVKDRVFSIIETALLQARFARPDIAAKELYKIGQEHKFLEDQYSQRQKRKRIMFVISELGLGGAQTFLLRLLRDFCERHDVYLYVYFKHTISRQFKSAIPQSVRLLDKLDLHEPDALRQISVALGIDLVFSHLFHADRLCFEAFAPTSIPWIVTDHGDFKIADVLGLTTFEELRALLERAHSLIVTSLAGQKSFERFGKTVTSKITDIPLGVDLIHRAPSRRLRRLWAVPDGTVVFLCAARGVIEKGWLELYDAFVSAQKAITVPIELWCLGEGPAISHLRARAHLEGRQSIKFFGFQRNVEDYMLESDCVIMLSKFKGETLNLSLIEALALGKPLVATDIGAISETVGRGSEAAGILVRVDRETGVPDRAEAEAAIKLIASDVPMREKFAQHAELRSGKFDMSKVSAKTIELAEWAISNPSR